MNDQVVLFETERPRLTALCYRMLGERAGAEDAVQETWLRWQGAPVDTIDNPAAWLRRTATNIAIDSLRSARHRRETYVGPWLPEPLIETTRQPIEAQFELAQECELALSGRSACKCLALSQAFEFRAVFLCNQAQLRLFSTERNQRRYDYEG